MKFIEKSSISICLISSFILLALTVCDAQDITTKSKTYYVPEGGRVVLDCYIADNPTEDKTLWTRSNLKDPTLFIGQFKSSKDEHIGSRFPNNSIEIINANKEDEGTYTCQLATGQGTIIKHTLKILYKPSITNTNDAINVIEGNTIKLSCETDGQPEPAILWERSGIFPANFTKTSSFNYFKAEPDVSGIYTCNASNELGSVIKNFRINVEFSPEIVISETSDKDDPTERRVICTVRANPRPISLVLKKVDTSYTNNEETIIEDENNNFLTKYIQTYYVRSPSDYGQYVCVARNSIGSNEKTHNVTLDRPKPPVAELIDFPQDKVLRQNSKFEWKVESQHAIINFEVTVAKKIPIPPTFTYSVLKKIDVKPIEDQNTYYGSLDLNDYEIMNDYKVTIKAINSYSQESNLETSLMIQSPLTSNAMYTSFNGLILILIISIQLLKLKFY